MFNSFDDCQFAYKPKSSTVCALLTIQESILKYLDDPDIGGVRVITFDMSHAFDSVSHEILLNRIASLDFSGCVMFNRWLRDYLSNRMQRVRFGESVSSFCDVKSGVPQGSILGPYLFSVFMSTFSAVHPVTVIVKYADDATLVVPACLLYTSPSPRDRSTSRMPSSA